MRYIATLGLLACLSTPVLAQDRAATVLVLDGSGSMWGQIDGTAKITIAQSVVDDLLKVIPAEQALGLTVYGHRRKGDCSDIETLVVPGIGTQKAISDAVHGIKPKGKTPMTDAVIAAAKSLRYTEEKATVILVSDGIETCNPDPCAAARALEDAGVDFTAHVIGFDVSDPNAVAQMQCLATETGGTFRMAGDAKELGSALVEVIEAPEPVSITFRATAGGAEIGSGLIWSFAPDGTGQQTAPTGTTQLSLLPGDYSVSVLRLEDEATAEAAFTAGEQTATITLVLPELLPAASLEAPATAVAGSKVEVTWMGPNNNGDYIALAAVGAQVNEELNYTYTDNGNPAALTLPTDPGSYELRYIANGDKKKILASRPITGTAPSASLEAPATAVAGSKVGVTWVGPNNNGDYIALAAVGAQVNEELNYTYTDNGNPAALTLPTDPGSYELRYIANGDKRKILASRPITGTAPSASLEAPVTAVAGSTIEVTWVGPNNNGDYIALAAVGAQVNEELSYTYTDNGNPAALTLPTDPGSYELRYIANGDKRKILASRPITGTAPTVALEAPETVAAGAKFEVTWVGPNNDNDAITVAILGSKAGDHVDHRFTVNGNPAPLTAPDKPGTYVLRYVASGNKAKVLARRVLTVSGAGAGPLAPGMAVLEAAERGVAGGQIEVFWAGPGFAGDMIVTRKIGSVAAESSVAVTSGNPVVLPLPAAPGQYLIHYLTGAGQTSIGKLLVLVE